MLRFPAISLSFAIVSAAAQAKCFDYEPAKVVVTGVIFERVDPGPPGYGEDPKHDTKEPHLYLKLDSPICTSSVPGDDLNTAESGVTEMEMVYFVESEFRKEWLGEHVSVTGTLFHGVSGHHWTSVLITPSETHVLNVERGKGAS